MRKTDMESIFTGDEYRSEEGRRLPLRHYLFLGSRWGMYFTFIKDVGLPFPPGSDRRHLHR
jgi:hypothetical protein